LRISDWSSDVCSSDLNPLHHILTHRPGPPCWRGRREVLAQCAHFLLWRAHCRFRGGLDRENVERYVRTHRHQRSLYPVWREVRLWIGGGGCGMLGFLLNRRKDLLPCQNHARSEKHTSELQ